MKRILVFLACFGFLVSVCSVSLASSVAKNLLAKSSSVSDSGEESGAESIFSNLEIANAEELAQYDGSYLRENETANTTSEAYIVDSQTNSLTIYHYLFKLIPNTTRTDVEANELLGFPKKETYQVVSLKPLNGGMLLVNMDDYEKQKQRGEYRGEWLNVDEKGKYINSATVKDGIAQVSQHSLPSYLSSVLESDFEKRLAEEKKIKNPYIGMSKDELKNYCAWGKPDKVITSQTEAGLLEEWTYKYIGIIFVQNGKVAEIRKAENVNEM